MQVYILEIRCNVGDREELLHPAILAHEGEMVLVDCGYPGSLPLLENAADAQGLSLAQLTSLVVTHHDIDHMGGAAELVEAYPGVKVYTSEGEASYVSGKRKSLRLQQAEDLYPSLPDEYKAGADILIEALKSMETVAIDEELQDNGYLLDGNVHVVPTPGHTPGHFSLYIPQEQLLVAADALVVENGILGIANPQFTLDLTKAYESVAKISAMPLRKILCYHGGLVTDDIATQLSEIMKKAT